LVISFSQIFYARGFRRVTDRSQRRYRPRQRWIEPRPWRRRRVASGPAAGYDHAGWRHAAAKRQGAAMTDYRVSKLFFDLQHDPKLAAEYRADMAAVLDRYEIKPELRTALEHDDVGALAPLVNAYLLRFYFQIRGMPQDEFIARLHALKPKEGAHG
jgi:hypothetical protein